MKIHNFFARVSFFALGLTVAVGIANAAVIPFGTTYTYQFNVDGASNAPRPGSPYGTIVLTQKTDDVGFKVTLPTDDTFVLTGAGAAFAFNIGSGASVVLSGSNATSFITGDTVTASNFGMFNHRIDVKSHGNSGSVAGPLTFDVNLANIQITDFGLSSTGVLFSGDIGVGINAVQGTGTVGTTGAGTPVITRPGGGSDGNPVPEPSPLALLGLGVLSFIVARRKAPR